MSEIVAVLARIADALDRQSDVADRALAAHADRQVLVQRIEEANVQSLRLWNENARLADLLAEAKRALLAIEEQGLKP